MGTVVRALEQQCAQQCAGVEGPQFVVAGPVDQGHRAQHTESHSRTLDWDPDIALSICCCQQEWSGRSFEPSRIGVCKPGRR